MHPDKWKEIINNNLNPLFNRAIRGTYPPGSIFKLIVVLAAYNLKDFNPNKKYFCNGSYKFGDQIFHCWNDKGHGFVDCKEALAVSCDCYFYELSLMVGIDNIYDVARKFGLGNAYLEEIYRSSKGLIPSKVWKKQQYGRVWTKTDTIVTSIGQGFALASPLQLAVMISRIASGGKNIMPKILKQNSNINENNDIENLNKEAISLIKKGMYDAVNSSMGTAYASRTYNSGKLNVRKNSYFSSKKNKHERKRRGYH